VWRVYVNADDGTIRFSYCACRASTRLTAASAIMALVGSPSVRPSRARSQRKGICGRAALAGVVLSAVALLAAPRPTCGATRCDTPMRWESALERETASGLAKAEEKFQSCARAPSAPRQARWRAPSAGPPQARSSPKEGGSKLKRPSDVGTIINRCRADEAKRTSPMSDADRSSSSAVKSSARGTSDTPAWSSLRDVSATPRLSAGRAKQQQQQQVNTHEDCDPMLDSPSLFSSSKGQSAQHDSNQATPACYSHTRASSLDRLSKSDLLKSAAADTPHLRASDWAEHTPEPIMQRGSLSQKLFAQDDLLHSHAQMTPTEKLLSAIKLAQEQQLHQQQKQQVC
jgi:hypothetical protein